MNFIYRSRHVKSLCTLKNLWSKIKACSVYLQFVGEHCWTQKCVIRLAVISLRRSASGSSWLCSVLGLVVPVEASYAAPATISHGQVSRLSANTPECPQKRRPGAGQPKKGQRL